MRPEQEGHGAPTSPWWKRRSKGSATFAVGANAEPSSCSRVKPSLAAIGSASADQVRSRRLAAMWSPMVKHRWRFGRLVHVAPSSVALTHPSVISNRALLDMTILRAM
jgi:hypothetical protein